MRVLPESEPAPAADSLEDRVRALKLPEHEHGRSRVVTWGIGLAIIAVVGAGGWYGFTQFASSPAVGKAKSGNAGEPANPKAPAGTAAAPAANDNEVALVSTGHILAARQMLVSPKVVGKIMYLNAEEGQVVKQGDVLAKIEDVEFKANYDKIAADLEKARHELAELKNGNRPEDIAQAAAELGEQEARLPQLEADWKRKRDLRATGNVTPGELDEAQADYHAQQHRVEQKRAALKLMKLGPRAERIAVAEANVRHREAELVMAKWQLDNCTITAPISGTILLKNTDEGEVVDPRVQHGSFSICEMANLADIEAELMVPEREVANVRMNQRCKIRPEAYKDRDYDGFVSRLMPMAQRDKGAIRVRVKINVPQDEVGVYLKPDMSARVTFLK